MGFLSGSTTFERYWITQDPTPELGSEHLETLEKFKIGKLDRSALDEPNVGFSAGSHLLDTRFDLAKNVIGDAMHFGVRIDTDQIPAAVRNAWLQMELAALTVDNPSGRPTKTQRQEAKEAVEARCEEEAGTGRFRRMQQVSVLWDAMDEMIYIGSSSPTANETCVELLERSFGLELDRVTSGKLAKALAADTDQKTGLYEIDPALFHADQPAAHICWWNGMAENFDYLGNEFLLWLWWHVETESDQFSLGDDTEAAVMFARTLSLDCPLGESGKETISSECPIALPEAGLALRSGKLPRKTGLTLVRDGQQFDLTLQAESFSIGGAKITRLGEAKADYTEEDRIASIRDMSDTIDLLFHVFCERRITKAWKSDLKNIQNWLQLENLIPQRKSAA